MMSVMTLSALGTVDRLAASITWNGGGADNNWSSAANWSGATPIELDSLTFGGASRLSNINDWLVKHGQTICSANYPNCGSCFLNKVCAYGRRAI